jgi:protein-disulfide isomerase
MDQHVRPATLAASVSASDHRRGSESAHVTLVEYGDFECPACGQAYHAVKIMLAHFGSSVRFVFRHFPLREIHPHAELAAEAAEAAGAQHKFWQMHDLLFENQAHLKAKSLALYAAKVDLDLKRYEYEMNDHFYLQHVQEDIASGTKSDVRSTPAFFINGVLHDVSFGFDSLEKAIEAELGN